MEEKKSYFRWWPRRAAEETPPEPTDALAATEELMKTTLGDAVRGCDPLLEIVSHSARVASLVDWLAAELDLPEEDREVLRLAATLHEVGMVAVPPEILDKPAPLSGEELEQVRAQAWIGANVVRLTHSQRAARLIRYQYCDYDELRGHFPADSPDLLLAGVLRVADVFDAMCYPRPYQRNLTDEYRTAVLRGGMGTKFHPRVTRLMLRTAR
jgi:two-component system, cell cycle response regulator